MDEACGLRKKREEEEAVLLTAPLHQGTAEVASWNDIKVTDFTPSCLKHVGVLVYAESSFSHMFPAIIENTCICCIPRYSLYSVVLVRRSLCLCCVRAKFSSSFSSAFRVLGRKASIVSWHRGMCHAPRSGSETRSTTVTLSSFHSSAANPTPGNPSPAVGHTTIT